VITVIPTTSFSLPVDRNTTCSKEWGLDPSADRKSEQTGSRSVSPYPPISDFAFISDCHSSALISRDGSIDWCCMPRMDSSSCFARLLDWDNGGFCQLRPTTPYSTTRRYLPDTLVLETTFHTDSGKAKLIDFFSMREGGLEEPHQQIIRVLEGVQGQVEFELLFEPRFDYGGIRPWIRREDNGTLIVLGGAHGLLVSGDCNLGDGERHTRSSRINVREGKRQYISIVYRAPAILDLGLEQPPTTEQLEERFEETTSWWRDWASQGRRLDSPYADLARRSAIVLKGLSNAPTGAILAAATTSLPESKHGDRNWDYRFTWIRDSVFTVRSLVAMGHVKEADAFRRFVERSASGDAEEIQVLFGVGGERRLGEFEIPELRGYRDIGPVRVGNAAVKQTQLDVFGELLDLSYSWHQRGNAPTEDYWEFVIELVEAAIAQWREPDRGIWEMRSEPRHFVHSKAMCWSAMDCGIRMAEELRREVPLERWRRAREAVRAEIEKKGYDHKRGVFIQAFRHPQMDASLLLLPMFRFVDYGDPRMIRTVEAIREELEQDGYLRRYATSTSDGAKGEEATFLTCTFWLAEVLGRQGRKQEAEQVLARAVKAGNDLGLFSEEFDVSSGEMMGNFPQGLTHLALIGAVVALHGGTEEEELEKARERVKTI
jgi:GH15 family glucan-1,4-alpha-glucosidase